MLKKFCYGYFDAPGVVGDAGSGSKNLPADVNEREVLDREVGKEEDKKEEDKEEEKDEEEKVELDENEDEKEEEDKEKDEEDEDEDGLELEDKDEETSLYQRLKAKDKGIFKEIPELRTVLFREQEFTKRFPTIDDAQEALDLADTFISFQKDIESGNAETFLEATKQLGEDKLTDFSANFLPSLMKVDKETYYKVVQPEFKRLLRSMVKHENEDVRQSAKNINWALWGTTDVEKDEGFIPEKNKTEDKVSKREEEWERRQLETFTNDVKFVGLNRARKIISKSLADFGLTPITEKHLTNEILSRTLEAMDKDVRYNGNMNVLWKKAKSQGFVTEGKESLVNAFLSRAKVSISRIRQQVLSEAKVSASGKPKEEGKKPTRLSGNSSAGKSGQALGRVDPKKVDWNSTSERDLLDGKPPVMRK